MGKNKQQRELARKRAAKFQAQQATKKGQEEAAEAAGPQRRDEEGVLTGPSGRARALAAGPLALVPCGTSATASSPHDAAPRDAGSSSLPST